VKPLVTLGDAERETIDALKAGGMTASTTYPSSTLSGTAVVAQVELEALNTDDYPVVGRAQVRVTLHAAPGRRNEVKAAADKAMRLLYSSPGNAAVAAYFPRGGGDVSTDPDTKNLMCWVLMRADLKAVLLAS
jgi:hypothetical protein